MKCIILWFLGFPAILFHCLIPLTIIISIIAYKIYASLDRKPTLPSAKPISMAIEKKFRMIGRRTSRVKHSSHMALVVVLMIASSTVFEQVDSLEQDAKIIEPFADLAKSIIRTATLGKPLEINITPSDLIKSIGSFAWRSKGFPVTTIRSFFDKVQDFYNDIKVRVDLTPVENIERKSLRALKEDLDAIVDAIVEEVRQSPNGLYTDYLKVNVNGQSLKDASTAVGVQFKAYGIDLTNYRNIAGAVLGVPLMPQIASSVVSVAKLAPDVTGRVTSGVTNGVNLGVSTLTSATSNSLSTARDMATRFIPYQPLTGTL